MSAPRQSRRRGLLALADRLPLIQSICGIPLRGTVLLLTPLLAALIVVEAAWDLYILIEWSNDSNDFAKIFSGLQAAALIIIFLLVIICFFGTLVKKEKIIRLYGHGAVVKGIILGIVGIIHIVSVANNQDDIYDQCINQNNSTNKCNTIKDLDLGLAIGLWIPQELLLFVIATALHSYIHFNLNMRSQKDIEAAANWNANPDQGNSDLPPLYASPRS